VSTAKGPQLRAAKRLLDLARNQGFTFQRIAPSEDGPLFAAGTPPDYRDEIYLGGFSDSCHATRARHCSLNVPGGLPSLVIPENRHADIGLAKTYSYDYLPGKPR
jgi:hypothetical protein